MTNVVQMLSIAPRIKPEDVADTLTAIEFGRRLLDESDPPLRAILLRLFKYCVNAERSFTDRERSWLYKSTYWPELSFDALERQIQAHGDYELRDLKDPDSGKSTGRMEMLPGINARERVKLEIYLTVMRWLRYVKGRDPHRDRDVFLDLAKGRRVALVRAVHMPQCGESAVEMVREKVLRHITQVIEPVLRRSSKGVSK